MYDKFIQTKERVFSFPILILVEHWNVCRSSLHREKWVVTRASFIMDAMLTLSIIYYTKYI